MCRTSLLVTVLAVGLSGCVATMGTGVGSTLTGQQRVTFQWHSSGYNSGRMNATLDNGRTFVGDYFQITRNTRADTLGPLWAGWGPGFGYPPYGPYRPWGYWGPSDQFLTEYTGRVVANLEAPDGSHIRCRFTLARPDLGMAGGGLGQCQLPSGMTIDATFPAAMNYAAK